MDSQADRWTLTIPMSPPNCVGVDKNVMFDLVPNWTIISWGPMNISSTMDYVMAWHLTGCIFNEELGHPVGAKPLTKPGLLMLSLRKYFKENKKVTCCVNTTLVQEPGSKISSSCISCEDYRKTPSIIRTKAQNLNVSHLVFAQCIEARC